MSQNWQQKHDNQRQQALLRSRLAKVMPEKAQNVKFTGEPAYLVQAKQRAAESLKNRSGTSIDRQTAAAQTQNLLSEHRGKPIYEMTCKCALQRNGRTIQLQGNEDLKRVQVFKTIAASQTEALVQVRIEQAISHQTVICFNVTQIAKCYAQKLGEGMLTFVVSDSDVQPSTQAAATAGARPIISTKPTRTQETNVMLSRANLEQAKTLISKLQDKSMPAKPQPKPLTTLKPPGSMTLSQQSFGSKKRVLGQMTQSSSQNDSKKLLPPPSFLKSRKMPQQLVQSQQQAAAVVVPTEMIVDDYVKRKLSLSDLPWDTVNIIFDFTPTGAYNKFRVNRAFTRLINKRRKGLSFKDKAILPDAFMKIITNNQISLKELHVLVPIKRLKIALFDQCMFKPRSLQVLDIRRLENISEKAFQRMVFSAQKTLETLKMTYKGSQSFTQGSMVTLAKCEILKNLEFASPTEFIANIPAGQLQTLKHFFRRKQSALKSLRLYEADAELLKLLASGPETHSLEDLQILKFNQSRENANNLVDLVPIGQLRSIERLSLCPMHHSLNLDIAAIDNQLAASNATISGSRELEQIIFKLRGSLVEVRLGNYIWDDLIIYMAELCKELEVLEFNSHTVSDAAISHVLKRSEHLTTLDVAGCKTFTGLAFSDVTIETLKAKKLRWVQANLGGHELQMAQNRLTELGLPNCTIVVNQDKKF